MTTSENRQVLLPHDCVWASPREKVSFKHSETKTSTIISWANINSGVARAFPGGRGAHPEGQNEEKNKKSLRKNKKNMIEIWGKWGKRNSRPPGIVRLATAQNIKTTKFNTSQM